MNLSIILPVLVCLLGAVVFVATKTNGDIKEIGRVAFAFGLLVSLLVLAGKTLHLST